MSTVNINATPNGAVTMVAAMPFCRGCAWWNRDGGRADNIDAAATRIFGVGAGPGEDRPPIAMKVATEMTDAFFMLHLPSAIWLLVHA